MLTSTKSALQSKAVIGSLASLVAMGATIAFHADPASSQAIGAQTADLLNAGLTVITIGGSLLALYGRLTATKRITIGTPAAPTAPPANLTGA